jgi:hypothetical protein
MSLRPIGPIFLFAILFWPEAGVFAQTQHWFTGWGAVFTTCKLSPKFSIHFDAQIRTTNEWKAIHSYIIRPGLNYLINKNMIATLGYAYIGHHRTIDSVSGWGPESRIWEQFIINSPFNIDGHPTSLQNRFRLEQRFISKSVVEGDKFTTDGYNIMQRFRYFVRSIYPLAKCSVFREGPYISLQDEIFFNVENAGVTNNTFFDQNRFYTSIGYRTSPKFDIEVGYMNQFLEGRANNTVNNICQVAGYLRLP